MTYPLARDANGLWHTASREAGFAICGERISGEPSYEQQAAWKQCPKCSRIVNEMFAGILTDRTRH